MANLSQHKAISLAVTLGFILLAVAAFSSLFGENLVQKVSATPVNTIFISTGSNIGNDSSCSVDGQTGQCYANIQAAINDALANAVIKIGPGTYYTTASNPYHGSTTILVNKNVTIQGDSKDTVMVTPAAGSIVPGGAGGILSEGNTVFLIQSDDVMIKGITLEGANGRNGIVYDYNNASGTLNNITVDNVLVRNVAFRGIHISKPSGDLYNINIKNSTFRNINVSSGIGIEVVGAKDNVFIQHNTFYNTTMGVKGSHGSDVLIDDNTFTNSNIGVYLENTEKGGSNAVLNNTMSSPVGSNSVGIYVKNHTNNVVLLYNSIDGMDQAIVYVISATPYGGQFQVLENTIEHNGYGLDIYENTPVSMNVTIGRMADANHFEYNTIDVRLNPGANDTIPAEYNTWSGGSNYPAIEPRIIHKGIMPTGDASAADGLDSPSLGQVLYTNPINASKRIVLHFPPNDHSGSNVYGPSQVMTLAVEAEYDPFTVDHVNFRIGYKGNAATDTCLELYNLSPSSINNVGNNTSQNGVFFYASSSLANFTTEGEYLLCAYMFPGASEPNPGYSSLTTKSAIFIIDRTPPNPPATIGWTDTTPPVDLINVNSNPGFRACDSWVNNTMVDDGSIVWSRATDALGDIQSYEVQVYSEDYGAGTLNTVQGTPWDENFFHLPLLTNGDDDGTYYVRTRATDAANNVSAWSHPNTDVTTWCRFDIDTLAPAISIPNYYVDEGADDLQVEVTATDANNIDKYEWDMNEDGTFELDTLQVYQTTIAASNFENGPISKSFDVRATDPAGNIGVAGSTITIDNVAPTVSLAPSQTVAQNQSVSFSGSFVDPGDESGGWDVLVEYGDGDSETFTVTVPGNLSIPTHAYTAVGSYTARLEVDDGSDTASSSVSITVVAAATGNVGVGFSASPLIPVPGQTVTFQAQLTNPESIPIQGYSWNFGDGGTGSGASATHAFSAAGNYDVILTVTAGGQSFSATGTISVVAQNNIVITVDAGPDVTAPPNQTITFHAQTSGPPSPNIQYFWDFGDGSSATTTDPYITYTYDTPGVYDVGLDVDGYPGGTVSDGLTVTVDENAPRTALDNNAGTVAGANTSGLSGAGAFQPTVFGMNQSSFLELLVLLVIVGGIGAAGYLYWKKRKKEEEDFLQPDYAALNGLGTGMNNGVASQGMSGALNFQSAKATPGVQPQAQAQNGRFQPKQPTPVQNNTGMGFGQ